MAPSNRYRGQGSAGLTLAESIVACFVMTAAMLVSATLYHSALNHSVRIDRMHRATRAVERRLEEIRGWSMEQHGTNGPELFSDGWDRFQGKESEDPEYPEFKITTTIKTDRAFFSPSTAFEEIAFAAQADDNVPSNKKDEKRTLDQSVVLVEVTGRWGDGPKDSFTARTLVADPVKDYGWKQEEAYKAIEISGAPAFLAPNGEATLTATVKDARGRQVRNAVVQWYVDPRSSGNGTLELSPTASDRCKFINQVKVVKDPDNRDDLIRVNTGGEAIVVARVRLGGLEAINKTSPITLGAPPE